MTLSMNKYTEKSMTCVKKKKMSKERAKKTTTTTTTLRQSLVDFIRMGTNVFTQR